jgi:preprotein translocase subunit SecE
LQVRALPDPFREALGDEHLNMALQEQWGKVREAVPRASGFLGEVWAELKKVHWPTRKETYAATLVVIVITILVALFLGLVDSVVAFILRRTLG